MAPFSAGKVQASASVGKKKTNPSHAGTRLPAQPEAVYLGILDPLHKDPRTEMGASAFPWQRRLSGVRQQPIISSQLLQGWRSKPWGSSLREDRLPQPSVTLRLSSPTGLSSEPP